MTWHSEFKLLKKKGYIELWQSKFAPNCYQCIEGHQKTLKSIELYGFHAWVWFDKKTGQAPGSYKFNR